MVKLCCNHVSTSVDWSSIISCIAESTSALVASFALVVAIITAWFAWREYKRMVRHKQCEVFAQYNERYENSEYIQKVVKYCTIKTDNPKEVPTEHDKEMFLRFFEELDLMIQEDYISKKQVGNYFSYYFMLVWNDETFFWNDEMISPYENKEKAQNATEWKKARHLFDQLKGKWYTKEMEKYQFPNTESQCKVPQ